MLHAYYVICMQHARKTAILTVILKPLYKWPSKLVCKPTLGGGLKLDSNRFKDMLLYKINVSILKLACN